MFLSLVFLILIDRLITYCFTSRSRIFHLYEVGVNQYIDTYRYLPTRRYTIQLEVDISISGKVYNVGFKVVIGIH
jgi:hypothetical protein